MDQRVGRAAGSTPRRSARARKTRGARAESHGLRVGAGRSGRLDFGDVGRLKTFGSLGHLEFDRLTLLKGLVSVTLDRGEMDEDVRPILLLDEAVTLAVVEPLHLALGHWGPSSTSRGAVDRRHRTRLRPVRQDKKNPQKRRLLWSIHPSDSESQKSEPAQRLY